MAGFYDRLLAMLEPWRHLGSRDVGGGTVLIGHVPHIARQAWMHELFGPAEPEEVAALQASVGGQLGLNYLSCLKQFNGLRFFSNNLALLGIRNSYRRDGSVFQPWDLAIFHNDRVADGLPEGALTIGSSNALYGGIAFVELLSGEVLALDRDRRMAELHRWPDFETFLFSEIHRLTPLFDAEGRVIDKSSLSDFGSGSPLLQ